MSSNIRVGVVGVGSLGQHHARIYSELDGVDLTGVYDVDPERASDVAEACGTTVFQDINDLASVVDAASVVVPTDRHSDVASLLMNRGIHLLVEKPIASSTGEAETMVALAEKMGVILQVGHIERFNPVMTFLEDNLKHPRFIEAIRLATYPPARESDVPRGTEVSVVLDLMIHDLEIILHVVRSPLEDMHAVGVPVLSQSEDIANVRLSFANGCVANVTASRISRERMRKVRVFQEDTYVSLDYMNQSGVVCRKTATGIVADDVPIEKGDALTNELASFVECVMNQSTPVVTGRCASEALNLAVRICQAVRENPS